MDRLRMICSLIIRLKRDVSNLELQKYLYFIQTASLMTTGKRAFLDEIEAWQYGPVVPRAYREFKYERDLILISDDNQLDDDIKKLVEEIVNEFRKDEAFQLVERTHSYSSWIDAWNSRSTIISVESIIKCHKKISDESKGLIF